MKTSSMLGWKGILAGAVAVCGLAVLAYFGLPALAEEFLDDGTIVDDRGEPVHVPGEPTPEVEDGPSPLGTCDCTSDAEDEDCYYYYVPAIDCAVNMGDLDTQYQAYHPWLANYSTTGFLYLYCPLQTHKLGKPEGKNIKQVKLWGYVYTGSASNIWANWVASTTTGRYDYGDCETSGTGNVDCEIYESDPATALWHSVLVRIPINPQASYRNRLHGLRFCAEP